MSEKNDDIQAAPVKEAATTPPAPVKLKVGS